MLETKNKIYDCESCLFKIISCQFLNAEEFELIRRTSTQMRYDKGETILRQGEKSQNLLFLHKGIVKFNYKNEADKNFTISISREDLANLAGIATESTIRTLSDFKEEKLIEINVSKITILNYEKLSKIHN